MVEDLKKKDEDEEYRNDYDPKGYDLYAAALKDPINRAYEFAVLVARHNPESKELHAKVIPIFLQKSKTN
jgi:hypothetical protein